MVAESLIRILEKQRPAAMALGTFEVDVVGQKALSLQPDDRLAIHDAVIAPLLANAEECRVYGISKQSVLFGLLSQAGEKRGRVWHLDVRRDLLHGYEPLWNAICEHNGVVVVTRPLLSVTEDVLGECGRPNACASHYQLYQGTSRAAVSYCLDVTKARDVFAFLFSGSNGLQWMDVFAGDKFLPVLWDQAMRRPSAAGDK